ncbi:MAG: hypothetical protein IIC89_03365 [Chloroflexi bacterium]|nr:hypothetical protein [Chloroflexota bacterium]
MALLNRTVATAAPRTTTLRLGPILFLAAAAVVAVAMLQVAQTSRATTASFAIQSLEQERIELDAAVRELEADVAGFASLSYIQEEAARLGMVPAESREAVEVNVLWSGASGQQLPTRFFPNEEASVEEPGSSWWQGLLEYLPFQ